MKWTKSEILENSETLRFEERMVLDDRWFADNVRINGVKDLVASGSGWFNEEEDRFYVKMRLQGWMRVPDAISGEEIEIPLDTESVEIYSFEPTDDEDIRYAEDDVVDLTEAAAQAVLLEAPMQATEVDEEDYPEGDGWKIYSEDAYEKSRQDAVDPRLAELKNYIEEKQEVLDDGCTAEKKFADKKR